VRAEQQSAPFVSSPGAAWRLGLVALVALAVAWGVTVQEPGANQNAHLALVTALADGTPRIDRYHEWTVDKAFVDGHFYTAKAPGLALLTEPFYRGLDRAGLVVEGPPPGTRWPRAQLEMPRAAVWQAGLIGATLPALLLLLMVRSTAERFAPGHGTIAAVCVGAGSLVGVFATMFFAHALSATLGFAAFALLVRERYVRADLRLVACAGAIAALGVVVEHPVGIVAVALGLYAAARPGSLRRAAAYLGGLAVGTAPLFAFNAWAFGTPLTMSYENAVVEPGVSGHDVVGANASGFFGVELPSLRVATELLASGTGLLVATPLWAFACLGLLVLWRDGHRAEALLVGVVAAAFLAFNASYYLPFGGGSPGPRFLVAMLPFLAVPLAAAWRARPLAGLVLALVSIAITTASLAAVPLTTVEDPDIWFRRLAGGEQVTHTVLWWLWPDSGVWQVLPVLLLVVVAVLLAFLVTPRPRLSGRDLALAAAVLVAWRVAYVAGPILLEVDRADGGSAGLAAAVGLLAAAVAIAALVARGSRVILLPAVAIGLLMWPDLAAHPAEALALVCGTLAAVAAIVVARRRKAAWAAR
jgi:hypothetical protein